MVAVEDPVTGPRSQPTDVLPAVALKRKLSAVSWPFRTLGTEGAWELLPGPLPMLLTRCKRGPRLGEKTAGEKRPSLQVEIEERKGMQRGCVPNHLG